MPLGSAWMASPIPCMCMLKLNVDASWYRGPYYFHILNGKYNAVHQSSTHVDGEEAHIILETNCLSIVRFAAVTQSLFWIFWRHWKHVFSFFSCNFKSASFQFIKRTYDCFVLFGLLYRRFSSSTRFVVRHLIIFLLGLKKEKKKNQNLIY